jgi:hypothetical protein
MLMDGRLNRGSEFLYSGVRLVQSSRILSKPNTWSQYIRPNAPKDTVGIQMPVLCIHTTWVVMSTNKHYIDGYYNKVNMFFYRNLGVVSTSNKRFLIPYPDHPNGNSNSDSLVGLKVGLSFITI